MAKTSLRKPLGVLANGVDGQVVLSWESVQGADGYEVFEKTEEENALPHGWENMPYEDFLVERRKLMAAKIKQAFEVLKNNAG